MSLRARVLAGVAVVALVLVVSAVVIARLTQANLIQQVDVQLERATGPVGRLLRPPPEGSSEPRLSSLYVGKVTDGRVETLVAPNLSGNTVALPRIDVDAATKGAVTGAAFTVGSDGSSLRYRVLASTDDRLGAVVMVALPLDAVDNAVGSLITVEVIATTAVLGVLALVTWWVVHLGVRPVKRMTETATAIADGELSHRVPDGDPRTEAGELGVALNHMLGRIEDAFDERTRTENRLRQFVADASHELRTPLTTIRGYAELFRAGGLDDRGELEEAMRRTEQESVRMAALVDDLLQLARLDQGRPLERAPVDLAAIAADTVRDARAVDPKRPVSANAREPVVVTGDDARLRQVVANLVANAMIHTPPGTPVNVLVDRVEGGAVVEVTDGGPGMTPEVAERAFERFFRADPSRSRARGGSGLGLAIVKATVEAHGGTVTLRSGPGRGTTVHVELPAAAHPSTSEPGGNASSAVVTMG